MSEKCLAFSELKITHPQFVEIQRVIKNTHKYSGIQPKVLLITSPSHCGKSTALTHYQKEYNNESDNTLSTSNFTSQPVLYLELDADISVAGLMAQILEALGVVNVNAAERVSNLVRKVVDKLKLYGIELIIIDEVQHMVPTTGGIKTQKIADHIKSVSNKTKIPFILAGLPRAKKLFQLSNTVTKKIADIPHPDDTEGMQLNNRARKGYDMKPYQYDSTEASDWMNIVESYETILEMCNIKIVDLFADELPLRLWLCSYGVIGRIKYVLQEAIELYEESPDKHQKIGLGLLSTAYDDIAEWAELGEQKPQNPFLLNKKELNRWFAMEVE